MGSKSKKDKKRTRTESGEEDKTTTTTKTADGDVVAPTPEVVNEESSKKKKKSKKSHNKSNGDDKQSDASTPATNSNGIRKNFYVEHKKTAKRSEEKVKKFLEKNNIILEGKNIPKFVKSFSHVGFPDHVVANLEAQKFKKPTPIQAQAWPVLLSGLDLVGLAETGSGKTLAFLLPALVHIDAQAPLKHNDGPIALVLAPTRELAIQIQAVADMACKSYEGKIRSTCIYGGVPKEPQVKDLKRGSEIVVATPGRLLDLLQDGATNLNRVSYLVLDEADRMLDMGFEPQIRAVINQLKIKERQTAMFSATWPQEVQKLASEFLNPDFVKVIIGSKDLTANHAITQVVEVCEEHEKRGKLMGLLRKWFVTGEEKIIIFMLYKKNCDFLARHLTQANYPVGCIHGDKSQYVRDQVIADFKSGKLPILIATDVAARGLDIKGVQYVINYEFPLTIADYVHRIGRTGRAGATGIAHTLFTKENQEFSRELYMILTEAKQKIPPKLEEWKHIGHRTAKKTAANKLYGLGNWTVNPEIAKQQKTHIKFD